MRKIDLDMRLFKIGYNIVKKTILKHKPVNKKFLAVLEWAKENINCRRDKVPEAIRHLQKMGINEDFLMRIREQAEINYREIQDGKPPFSRYAIIWPGRRLAGDVFPVDFISFIFMNYLEDYKSYIDYFGNLRAELFRLMGLAAKLGVKIGRFRYGGEYVGFIDKFYDALSPLEPWLTYPEPTSFKRILKTAWKKCLEKLITNNREQQ